MAWKLVPVLRLLNDHFFKYLVASSFFIHAGELPADSPGVPHWFLKPPVNKNYYYGAGVANFNYDSTKCISNAKHFAANEIVKSLQVRVKGGTADKKSRTGNESAFFANEIINENLSAAIYEKSAVLQKVLVDNNIYILIYINKDMSSPKVSIINKLFLKDRRLQNSEPPPWTKTGYKKDGYIYGVSNTEPYYDTDESWEYSATIARYRIAASLSEDTRSLIREYKDGYANYLEVMIEANVEKVLENTMVKERWYDPANHRYCTLVEYKISD